MIPEEFSRTPPPPPPPPTQTPPPPPPATRRAWTEVTPGSGVQIHLPTFAKVNVVKPPEETEVGEQEGSV